MKVDSLNINSYPLGALYIYVNTMFTYIHGVIYNTPDMPPRRGQKKYLRDSLNLNLFYVEVGCCYVLV